MPTAGTHITIIEQLVLKHFNELVPLLGNPDPTADDLQMHYAKLGAVGPDLLYMLGDYDVGSAATPLEDMLSLLVKLGGTFAGFSALSEQITRMITQEIDDSCLHIASELINTGNILSGVVTDGFIALLINSNLNLWGYFGAAARQLGNKPDHWYWADYLHYVHTGDFTGALLDAARLKSDKNLMAYALGYLTHYITDVVGHPYVNQIVQSPYRLHHQRHHLVENFMDAYVWERYHQPTPNDPTRIQDAPLDTPIVPPVFPGSPLGFQINNGTPFHNSRLNDHINIGDSTLDSKLDGILQQACADLQNLANTIGSWIGVKEKIDIGTPQDPSDWCKFMAQTIQDYYQTQTPTNLVTPKILAQGPDPRQGGFPSADDIAQAYGLLRLVLKIQTEETVQDPQFPDIVGDITKIIEDTMKKIANDIGSTPPPPTPNTTGALSLKDLGKYLADLAQWAAEVVEHMGEALGDFIAGVDHLEDAADIEAFRVLLWLFGKALYTLYQYFRDILVINAYSIPYTEALTSPIGSLNTMDLWITPGDLPNQANKNNYPVAEYFIDDFHSDRTLMNNYRPYEKPTEAQPGEVELPGVEYAAPYQPGDFPQEFIDGLAGQDDLFTQVPQIDPVTHQLVPKTGARNVGNAIDNCYRAITTYLSPNGVISFPNYDMDSDRGYAWLDWQPADGVWEYINPDPNNNPVAKNPAGLEKPELAE